MNRREFIGCTLACLAAPAVLARQEDVSLTCGVCGTNIPLDDHHLFLFCPKCREIWGNPHPKVERACDDAMRRYCERNGMQVDRELARWENS